MAMKNCKTSRRNNELSCASISYTGKSYEDYRDNSSDIDDEATSDGLSTLADVESSSYNGETTANDDDDIEDSVNDGESTIYKKNELLQKFENLKITYYDQNVEKRVLERSVECIRFSEFLNKLFCKRRKRDASITIEQKRKIKELYDKNQEICQTLKKITKKNRETHKETLRLYLDLEELMEERKEKWEDAVQVYKLNLGDSSAFVNLEDLEFSETIVKEKEKDCIVKGTDKEVFIKSFRIVQIARVLYNLICISGVSWSTNKNVLEMLDCAGKLLDKDFDLRKPKEFTKIINEVTSRLNKVKI